MILFPIELGRAFPGSPWFESRLGDVFFWLARSHALNLRNVGLELCSATKQMSSISTVVVFSVAVRQVDQAAGRGDHPGCQVTDLSGENRRLVRPPPGRQEPGHPDHQRADQAAAQGPGDHQRQHGDPEAQAGNVASLETNSLRGNKERV